MKAMVFAAGLGTRLHPYTLEHPKALIEIGGIPMLELVLRKLVRYGFNEIVINVHHFSDMIIDFVASKKNFGVDIAFSHEEDELLETGGGLMKARPLLDDGKPFLIHNVDIFSNLDLKALYQFHLRENPLATLAVKERNTSRSFLFNQALELCGWQNHQSGEVVLTHEELKNLQPLAFTAVHVVDPAIFGLIREKGKFSITPVYLRLAKDHRILGFRHDQDWWMDLGRQENWKLAENYLGTD